MADILISKKEHSSKPKMRKKPLPKQFICKFQAPLFSTNGCQDILVYNEDKSAMAMLNIPKKVRKKLFPHGEVKTYWICEKDDGDRGQLYPIKQVGEQEW